MLRHPCRIALLLCWTIVFVKSETDTNSTYAQEELELKETTEAQQIVQDPTEPIPRYIASLSGHVDEEGDFAFLMSSEENVYSIKIHGGLIVNNITKEPTLQIFGEYKFGSIRRKFKANEMEGFVLLPIVTRPLTKVLASIIGK